MKRAIRKIIAREYSIVDEELDRITDIHYQKIIDSQYNFSNLNRNIITQGTKKRLILSYPKDSTEILLSKYLKNEIDKKFKLDYPNRNSIINSLFNILPVIKDLNDFCVIRFDFKSFFDSVRTRYVYEEYFLSSNLRRRDKELFREYMNEVKYCYAGLNLSNTMTEIACRNFDKVLRARLEEHGVVFFRRYVDDALIVLNSYLSNEEFERVLKEVIKEVFKSCKVKSNPDKFYYMARRELCDTQSFDFLGYLFTLNMLENGRIEFKFGITESKIKKYKSRIRGIMLDYKSNMNLELFRQRIKLFSNRVVFTKPIGTDDYQWITKGLTSNYNELRYHINSLDDFTSEFLKNSYYSIMSELSISTPYFLNRNDTSSGYNLMSTLERNRSIILNPKVGLNISQLVDMVRKIDRNYNPNGKTYYQIAQDYLSITKI